jgi:hypothetical protein
MVSTTMMDVESLAAEFAAVRREAMEKAAKIAHDMANDYHDKATDKLEVARLGPSLYAYAAECVSARIRAASTDRGSE